LSLKTLLTCTPESLETDSKTSKESFETDSETFIEVIVYLANPLVKVYPDQIIHILISLILVFPVSE